MKKSILLLLLLLVGLAQAQSPLLLREIGQYNADASSRNFTELNGKTIFSANDGINGAELWITDHTTAGTVLLKDINTSVGASSNPNFLTKFNDKIYFQATDGINGIELWATDGTANGTQIIYQGVITFGSLNPAEFTIVNNKLFFRAFNYNVGYELYVTDGTTAGTKRVKDIYTSNGLSSFPNNLTNFNGRLFFCATDYNNSYELWVSDGTNIGTQLVKKINPDPNNGSFPKYFTEYNNNLYFQANDGTNGTELWISDGTSTGTQLLKDINPSPASSSNPRNFTVVNGKIYFSANDSINGNELWVTDGTSAGTNLVKDINPAYQGSSNPSNFIAYNNKLYFSADDGTNGIELWVSDGTYAGTILLNNINLNAGEGSNPTKLTTYNGKLYFIATTVQSPAPYAYQLYVTDGNPDSTRFITTTPAGTYISPLNSTALNDGLRVSNGSLFFNAGYEYSTTTGFEPYILTTTSLWDTVLTTPVKCFGDSNGTATVKDYGAPRPLKYKWGTSPIQLSDTATNLPAGNYKVTVTDQNMDSMVFSFIIVEPKSLSAKISILGKSASAFPLNGTPPYTYVWNTSPAQTTVTTSNLSSGTYSVTVKDANDCSISQSVVISSVQEVNKATSFSLSPNPATNQLTITTERENSSPFDLYLFDVTGKCLRTIKNNTSTHTSIAIDMLPAGYYLLKLEDENHLYSTKGFVITR